jgi:hypothetical protein
MGCEGTKFEADADRDLPPRLDGPELMVRSEIAQSMKIDSGPDGSSCDAMNRLKYVDRRSREELWRRV